MKCHFIFILFLFLISCSEKENTVTKKSTADYFFKKGEDLFNKNNDSAFAYFNKSLNYYIADRDSSKCVKALIYESFIQTNEGDYFGSEESSALALKFVKKTEHKNNNSIYNSIANSKYNLKNYVGALEWYKKALDVSAEVSEKIIIKNNIAIAYSKLSKYQDAILTLENIQKEKTAEENPNYKSKIIDNLAYTKFLQNPNYNAEPELNNALKIRENIKDLWGQNASHAHLADYFEIKNPQKALFHARKMYEIAKYLKSPDDEIEALQKLINLEDSESTKSYFNIFKNLNDSLQIARNKAKNQFALIRYEAEKNRAENEKLKADATQQKNKILIRNIIVFLLIFGIFISIFWYKRRQKLLMQQEQIKIKNTELKYSKKIHDVVANGLYQTMVEVENKDHISKEELLDQLEELYEKSRDISREDISAELQKSFSEKISEKLSSYASEKTKILIIGNSEKIWENISPKYQNEVFYILQELLVNMKKHSKATLVSLKFEADNKFLKIKYQDNGLGISNLEKQKGKGLQITENRIAIIGGEINFDKNPKSGLIVNFSIPI